MNYIQQAYKGQNNIWIFILTTLLVSGLFIINLIFFFFFGDEIDIMEEQQKLLELVPSKNFWLAVNLLVFVPLLALLFILVRYAHKRSIMSLTTIREKVDWGRIFFAFALIAIITIASFGLSYYMDPSEIELQFDAGKFAVLIIVSLLLFPVQIGLEEYLFRGYLMQQLGIMVKNKWFPLLVTSVFFGIFHGANPEVGEMGPVIMVFYIGTGLLLGIMTLMDNGLELALGFHFGNNFLAATLVTAEWSALQTDAIFIYTGEATQNTIMEIVMPAFIVYPIILMILAWKYKWTNWKEKLFGIVEVPQEAVPLV
ncbi:MAG: CPBP family intramembrane metalloprotease, partial [Flavobacteriaceae bacterium]|nr:CPBP family intramembrane metalloprotease [Flavobacteriaceae bacterium]